MNDSELKTLNFENNFENNNIDTVFDLKGANIENQNNYFFIFQFDWIFKKFKNENLTWKQFYFLFFSRMILVVLSVAAFLLPSLSINKHNINFGEFCGMIVVFVFLCSWLWTKIKTQEE